MSYIYMREWKEVFGMIPTVRKNFDNFTGKENEKELCPARRSRW